MLKDPGILVVLGDIFMEEKGTAIGYENLSNHDVTAYPHVVMGGNLLTPFMY